MHKDRIVEEIRAIREQHAQKFGNDLHAICEDFRSRQAMSGHAVVSRQPRKPVSSFALTELDKKRLNGLPSTI